MFILFMLNTFKTALNGLVCNHALSALPCMIYQYQAISIYCVGYALHTLYIDMLYLDTICCGGGGCNPKI